MKDGSRAKQPIARGDVTGSSQPGAAVACVRPEVGEGRDEVSAFHTAAAAGGGAPWAPWAPRRQAGRSVNSREQPEQTSRAA